MRQEDKEVDGFELERAEERKRDTELVAVDTEELFDLDGKPEFERDRDRTGQIVAAMHTILAREHIVINNLGLSKREQRALEALRTAVEGRDQEIHGFVYAADRRALLEQALAVLQPDLANMQQAGGKPFENLVDEIAGLRGKLGTLEAAQGHFLEGRVRRRRIDEEGDRDDKPEDKDDDTSLDGPERKVEKPASSLSGPEREAEPKPPSSLAGPERKPEPKPPTSLGDPEEIAAAARTPWWKPQ